VRVSIPALSIDAGLVDLGVDASGAMQVPTDGASIGWYDRSPTPGQNGPTVLAAHVSWNARPAVFFDLATVQVGQPVTLTRADGAAVTYRVTGVDSYPKDRFPTLQVYGNTTTPQLRLITCGGTFDAAAGHHRDNVVVYAAMDHTAPAPG
jgi:sortase (surface protein transpeptidase)